ncbi:MAG: HypC/HybG/HupF family hydrogenase formation chaperone [Pirellulales bacterium]|nr:HypC/HybG/HupF family hydrogenase formation chaperone [Planctomycetales bacterium]
MCLAIPGRVVEWIERDGLFARARVEFGGVGRDVNMQCTPDADVDDFVLVHAGIAISRVDADEAARILEALAELQLDEMDEPQDGREAAPPTRR